MLITRRRNYSVFSKRKPRGYYNSYLDNFETQLEDDSSSSSDDLLLDHSEDNFSDTSSQTNSTTSPLKNPSKKRRCCGFSIYTPNSSRFVSHYHSRLLQKFPFLVEMFYWIITWLFYRLAKILTDAIFTTSIIEVAQSHGLALLEMEQFSFLAVLFPYREIDLQSWFINGHQSLLAALNHFYALVHIPATVGFIGWYYYVAPSHATFAAVRRTLTLTNLLAFLIFTIYPTMPPRMLPPEYGFLDSVHDGKAASVWMVGKFVNTLAAMPSMHFGYATCISVTLIHHSTIFRPRESQLEPGEPRKNWFWKIWYLMLAIVYPVTILLAIVATANHYWLDAVVAAFVALVAYVCNEICLYLLPAEDLLLWCLRLEKPVHSTGDRVRRRSRRIEGK